MAMTHATASIPPFPIDGAAALGEVTDFMNAIIQTLRVSRTLLGAGRLVCFQGLEVQIAQLCARCLGLDRDDGSSLHPQLRALQAELDVLAIVVAAQRKPT